MRIALATSEDQNPLPAQEHLLIRAFEALDCPSAGVVWTQDAPDDVAARFDALVIRTTWDYHRDPNGFVRWLAAVESAGCRVVNPLETVRWNIDKSYLVQLEHMGFAVVPTAMTEPGEPPDLQSLMDARGWSDAVVKPRISAGARRTWRVNPDNAEVVQAFVKDAHSAETGWLVQPFMHDIQTSGEWSLMYFDGVFSHAVRKRVKPGDYRVQEEHGGTVHAEVPPAALAKVADVLAGAFPVAAPYLRLDLVETPNGPLVMEAEAIEPELFFYAEPKAAQRCAQAVVDYLAL